MHRGYIKLWRCIEDNDFYFQEKFTKAQAWIDLILLANHKDKYIDIRGNEILIKRGFVSRAEMTLAKRWGWSRGKVRRFVGTLKIRQQIVHHKSPILSQIEIVNYDMYQPTVQQTVQQTDINNNEKNVNNEKIKKENIKRKKYGEFILLSDLEYKKLVEDYGENLLKSYIEQMNLWIPNSKRPKGYKNYNAALRKWMKEERKLRPQKEKEMTKEEIDKKIKQYLKQ